MPVSSSPEPRADADVVGPNRAGPNLVEPRLTDAGAADDRAAKAYPADQYPFGPPPVSAQQDPAHQRPQSMSCHAVIESRWDARRGVTQLHRMRGKTPLKPRPVREIGPEPLIDGDPAAARASIATSAAGPLGGDTHVLDVVAGAGSSLVLGDISATLLLPGPHGDRSLTVQRVRVEEGASLVWIPHPIIASKSCLHDQVVEIDLAVDSRLVYREELVLGRYGEAPGSLASHLTVRRDGRPLMAQELRLGPDFPDAATPSVLGDQRCLGTVVAVDPAGIAPTSRVPAPFTAAMPLDGTAVQISALAEDMVTLRQRLEAGLRACGLSPQPDGPPG